MGVHLNTIVPTICAIKIPSSSNNLQDYSLFLEHMTDEKKSRIQKYRHNDDALRSLFGDILLRTMICKSNNLRNHNLSFLYNSYGKPYSNSTYMKFNVSHSGEWVVCAIYNSEVGIDIEEIKEIDYLRLSKRYFSEKEVSNLFNYPPHKQLLNFYKSWTLKESFIKNIGTGLSTPLPSFSIIKYKGNYCVHNSKGTVLTGYQFIQFILEGGYICSICIKKPYEYDDCKIKVYDEQELLDQFIGVI